MLNIDLVRSLLERTNDPAIAVALGRHDDALRALTEASRGGRPPGVRRQEAERALRAERTAAALEARPPTIDASVLTVADEAEAEQNATVVAASNVVAVRRTELDAAIRGAWETVLPLLAHERANARGRAVGAAAVALWSTVLWPPITWCPAHVVRDRRFVPSQDPTPPLHAWWPIPIEPATAAVLWRVPADAASLWAHWVGHVWTELGRRHFTRAAAGELVLHNAWTPPEAIGDEAREERRRRGFVTSAMVTDWPMRPPTGPAPYEIGDVVMVGSGPDGETGADEADVARLRRRTAR